MSTMSCAAAIQKAAPSLSDDDVEELLSAMIRREKAIPNRPGDLLRWVEAARAASTEELIRAAVEKRSRAINLARRMQRDVRYSASSDLPGALSDMLTTSQRAGGGRAMSTEALQREAQDGLRGAFLADLDKAGGLPILRNLDAATEEALVREVGRLNGALGVAAATDPRVKDIALVLAKHGERLRSELNAAGAWIGKEPGYVTRQSHDQRRVRAAGFEAWRDATLPRLDLARTFADSDVDVGDPKAIDGWLRKVWQNLASGNHHVAAPGGDKVDPLAGFKGPGNLARKLSEDRVLHFKGPDDWLGYNREFGSGNLVASFLSGLDHGARALGLMKVWGTNPEAAFRDDVQRLADRLRDAGDVTGSAKLAEKAGDRATLTRQWRTVSGDADRPGSATGAHVMGAIHMMESVARLGGMVLSAGSDLPVAASTLRHEGVGYWSHFGNAIGSLFEGVPKGVRGEVALRLSAGLNGMLGGLYHRMGYSEAVPGALARGADLFFKLNFQTWWQDSLERGVAFSLSSHVGGNLGKAWGDMDAGLRVGLERFGLTEADWKMVQRAAPLKDASHTYFTPDMLDMITGPDAAFARQARDRMGAWFASTLDGAVTRPGAYEKSILTLGEAPGTVLGETMRLLTKFKSYPLTFMTKHWTRETQRASSVPNAIGNVAGLVAMTTLFGFAQNTMKDIAKGRNPREVDSPADAAKVVGAALMSGGGMALVGDFLFAEYNRFGGGLASTLAGPTIGSVESLMRFYARAIRGEDVGAEAIGVARNEVLPRAAGFVPGGAILNTFYGKLALDHLVVHHLQEAVNPGYLRRLEQRLQKENNQTFFLPPGALAQ